MMKKNLLFLFTSLIIIGCSSIINKGRNDKELNYIPYYLKVYEADSLYLRKEYKQAYKILDSIFKIYDARNSTLYYEYNTYIKTAYLSNNKSEIKEKMNKLIHIYGLNKKNIKSDTILNLIYKQSGINELEYLDLRKLYLKRINLVLREEILEMVRNDQFYRIEYSEEDVYEKRQKFDSIIQKKLKSLFDNKIYPNEEVIGSFSIDYKDPNILFILLHTEDSIRLKYFLPKIKEFIKDGKCIPAVYGYMVDQNRLYNDQKQVYGTYNIDEIMNEDFYLFNLERKKIGLPNIENEIWRRNEIMKLINN